MEHIFNQEQAKQKQINQKIDKPKVQKSKFWVIGNIFAYTIVGLIVISVAWGLSAWLLVGFVGENIISILNWFIVIFALVFSIRTAVKMIMGETIIFRKDIIKISIGVTIFF